MDVARIGILTISDRASRGEYEDKGGPAIHAWFTRVLTSPWEAVARVIPDEQPQIESALRELSDEEGCCLPDRRCATSHRRPPRRCAAR
jgi:molybdopterin adenylyltransferase